jgi:putative CocE/NonD family hydrolase
VQEHRVILYVLGANRWRAEEAWPLLGTEVTSLYLRADGRLSRERPVNEPADSYVYDPHASVPTPPDGRVAVTELLARSDVLVYQTEPLDEPVELSGELSATLFASSSARDTDWMIRVVDIQPDGEALHVVDGIARARYRHSRTEPSPLAPGAVEQYEMNLWATSLVFDCGHRIGIVVSSSNFPKYDRHPNVYADLWRTTEHDFVVAEQTVHHSAEYPSAVHVPIIPAARPRRWIENPLPSAPLAVPTPRELGGAPL